MKIGYARVSTSDQTTSLQEDALKGAGCERVFVETASGAQRDRPQLAEALKFLRQDDTLVVWRLDRLARSVRQLVETIDMLEQRGVHFSSLTESIDTGTAGGKLVFHIFGALAEFERGLIRERTMAGLKAAKARGRIGGRPRAMDEKDLAALRALIGDGTLTINEIAQKLGVSRATLYRHLPSARHAYGEKND